MPYNEILSGDYVRDILNNIVSLWFTTDGLMDMVVLLCYCLCLFQKTPKHSFDVQLFVLIQVISYRWWSQCGQILSIYRCNLFCNSAMAGKANFHNYQSDLTLLVHFYSLSEETWEESLFPDSNFAHQVSHLMPKPLTSSIFQNFHHFLQGWSTLNYLMHINPNKKMVNSIKCCCWNKFEG